MGNFERLLSFGGFGKRLTPPQGDSYGKSSLKIENPYDGKPIYLRKLTGDNGFMDGKLWTMCCLGGYPNSESGSDSEDHLVGHTVIGIRNTKEPEDLIAYLRGPQSLKLERIYHPEGHAPKIQDLRKNQLVIAKSLVRILLDEKGKSFEKFDGKPYSRIHNEINQIFKQLDAYKQMFGSSF